MSKLNALLDSELDILGELNSVDEEAATESEKDESKIIRSKAEVRRVKRKIVQLARVWSEYDIAVLPGDWWKCGFSEKSELSKVIDEYLKGERDTLDDLPQEMFRPENILYPEEKLYEESEDEIDGKINHEGGHAVHTNFRNWFKIQKRAIDEGYLPSTASGILNSVEDAWVNNKQIGISVHKRKKFEALYGPWIEHHKKIMKKLSVGPAVQILLISKWVQEKLGIIKQSEFEKMYEDTKPQAQEYFDKLINPSREYWNSPDSESTNIIFDEEIWPLYRDLEEKGVQEEITEEILREIVKRMKEQGPSKGSGDQQGRTIKIDMDKLPQDLKDDIKDLLEQQANQAQQSNQGEGESSSQGEQSDQGQPSQDQGGQPQGQGNSSQDQTGQPSSASSESQSQGQPSQDQAGQSSSESQSSSGGSGEISEETSKAVKGALGEPDENNLPQVPEDLQNRINKALEDNLSEEERKNLQNQARQQLDKDQAEKLNEDGLPMGQKMEFDEESGTYMPSIDSPEENEVEDAKQKVKDIEEQERKDQEKRDELREKIEEATKPEDIDEILENEDDIPDQFKNEIKNAANAKKELLQKQRQSKIKGMKNDGFMEKNADQPTAAEENLYDEYKSYEKAVRGKVNRFVESIMPHIPKKKIIKHGDHLVQSGTELDNEILGDFGSVKQGYVFKSPEFIEKGDPRIFITFVVDRSGSMKGSKLEESMKTLIFFALALKEIGVRCNRPLDFSIKFFDNTVSDVKAFEDEYDSNKRIKWKKGKQSTVKKRLMTESKKSGGTDLGLAIVEANDDLKKRKREYPDYMSCLFAISDGETFGQLSGHRLTRFIKGLEEYQGKKMGKHLKVGFYLRGGERLTEAQKAEETPMEQYFGERGKETVVVDNFKELVPQAQKVLRKTLIRMANRLFK